MKQPAIPKLSELSTAGRAEFLSIWTATLGKPSAALRTSRELLASALAWQLPGAQIWWPYCRHQAQAARPGARSPAQEALSSIAGGIDKSSPRQRNQQAVAWSAARGDGAGRWL